MGMGDIYKENLAIFEVSGAPIKDVPKKARENAENQVKLIKINVKGKLKTILNILNYVFRIQVFSINVIFIFHFNQRISVYMI